MNALCAMETRVFCRKDAGLLRTMDAEKLLKTIPSLQRLLDTLVEFDVSVNDVASSPCSSRNNIAVLS